MKIKPANKKGKKRSLSETTLPVKTEQKPQNLTESKKSSKKIKLNNVQNGSPVSVNKLQTAKKADKQKSKKAKQQNKESNERSSINETKTVAIEATDKNLSNTNQKKLEFRKQKNLKREAQRENRKKIGKFNIASITLDVKQIKSKIAEIKSRKELSKTAKRKLSLLQRKLRIEESNKSEKPDTTKKKSNKKDNVQAGALIRIKQKPDDKDQLKAKKKHAKKVQNESEKDDDIESLYENLISRF